MDIKTQKKGIHGASFTRSEVRLLEVLLEVNGRQQDVKARRRRDERTQTEKRIDREKGGKEEMRPRGGREGL